MELFLWEHKRLWKRKSTQISVLLCLIYVVVFGSILSYQWFTFGSRTGYNSFRNRFDGYASIRACQQYAGQFGGVLTDEALQEMVRDYQSITDRDDMDEMNKTDRYKVPSWVSQLYPELNHPQDYRLEISYVEPEKLTGFYERRQKILEDFLAISDQTGEEREYLLKMNEKVEQPFRYQWTEGWNVILGSNLPELGMVMTLFLTISLAPVFAGEWHDRTGPLLLTTKNGWKEAARAKICSGLALAVEIFGLILVGGVGSQLFFLGTEGWDMPIQMIKLIAVAPMNMLQAEIFGYVFVFLGVIGYAGLVMLLSSCAKSTFSALLLGLSAVYLPLAVSEYLPFWAQKALDLLPLVGSPADIFRTNTFCIFGKYVWSPYLLIIVPVLLGLGCVPFAVRRWARRMRR